MDTTTSPTLEKNRLEASLANGRDEHRKESRDGMIVFMWKMSHSGHMPKKAPIWWLGQYGVRRGQWLFEGRMMTFERLNDGVKGQMWSSLDINHAQFSIALNVHCRLLRRRARWKNCRVLFHFYGVIALTWREIAATSWRAIRFCKSWQSMCT